MTASSFTSSPTDSPDASRIVVEYVNPERKRNGDEAGASKTYKIIGLLLLTIQQASMPLMVRYSRIRTDKAIFLTTSSVFMMEVIKITVCSLILIGKERSISRFFAMCKDTIFCQPWETCKICIPALIYTLQNNLYYVALSHLEATTFCVTYQFKIFTTAIFLMMMMNRKISCAQWSSLVMLAVGVVAVQLQQQTDDNVSKKGVDQNPLLGLAAALSMCFTSAFAGVYLEKILKGSKVNVWMQNIRLAVFGLPISAFTLYYKDYDAIMEDGLLHGWDWLVWTITANNSVGGLLIAVVMKYADNILKTYAQSMAILGAAVGSAIWFEFAPNRTFLLGTMLVILSMYLYTKYPAKTRSGRMVNPRPVVEVLLHNPVRSLKPTFINSS
uniref:Uncharacterized protein n=1 Tax=Plectus sambesii TaxID=2011161 RepID=A0A914V2T9_9BILA